jgi:nitrogen regulatory protein PII-like uncharacterized protein
MGAGVAISAVNAVPSSGTKTTIPLAGDEPQVVFLAIEGDYRAMTPAKLTDFLVTAHELELLGESLRADTNSSMRVWAVVSKDSSTKLAKSLKRTLKKLEFTVAPLNITVLSPLGRAKSRDVRSAARAVELADNKVPLVYQAGFSKQLWVFHDPKLNSKKVEKVFRATEVLFDFYHQEFDLTAGGEAKASANLDELNGCASEKLDLVRCSRREDALVVDVYLRNMSSFQLLEKSKRKYLCPALANTLLKDCPSAVVWSVTLSNDGFPFVGN